MSHHLVAAGLFVSLLAPAGALAAESRAGTPPLPAQSVGEGWQDDTGGFYLETLARKTLTALDSVGVALTDNPKNPTGPITGAGVWGCYIGGLLSLSGAPMFPGLASALSTAIAGMVGAFNSGQSVLPIMLWTIPGIVFGALLSAAGLGLAVGLTWAFFAWPAVFTAPVIGIVSAGILVYGVLSTAAGPLTLAGIVHAEDGMTAAALAERGLPPADRRLVYQSY